MTTCTPHRASFGVMMAVMVGTSDGSAFVGRDAALADLHRDHYRSMLRLACLLVDDVGSGEEVVQDAFVRVYRVWPRVEDLVEAQFEMAETVEVAARAFEIEADAYEEQIPGNAVSGPMYEAAKIVRSLITSLQPASD